MTNPTAPARLVVLISGAGSTMRAVLDAQHDPGYGARIVAVISDRADAAGLAIAAEAGVPTSVVALADYPDRAEWDRALAEEVARHRPDLVLLAGFMRLIGAPSLSMFGGRIVNTHPALLPSYPGAHGVRDALAGGAKVTGCTVMLVDAGVDTGPIIAQAAVEVWDDDTETSLHERIKTVERGLVTTTVGRMAREGWTVEGRRVTLGTTKGDA
ncbi:phosphoribosylglycinamide formyltransferase [Demequina sp. EGI L300058]|uniref:Phosphoribosylglycinamide formyltransferase n=2 Tax=Demequina muriae TaxID=3051664 RepID=A0ABT8GHM2_9MICO|nr:phosphoribosylglycinamide formyltransferase [Demequina sp. EGI L300058]MDN4480933.1 phosphoribosylglycinamide formyltransferase [Demequina sp. EGI L300058]